MRSICAAVCVVRTISFVYLILAITFFSFFLLLFFFFFQAEDGIRDAQESRGLGDVYKRQVLKP